MSDPLKEASVARTKLRRIAAQHNEAIARAHDKRMARVDEVLDALSPEARKVLDVLEAAGAVDEGEACEP